MFNSLLIIALVAFGTYSLRISGLLLSNKFAQDGKIKVFLDSLPASLLIALISPSIINEGLAGIFAALCIVLSMYKTKNIILSMFIGILIIAVNRNY